MPPFRMQGRPVMANKPSFRFVATILAVAAILSVLALMQAAQQARLSAVDELRRSTTNTLRLVVENLNGELAKYSFQPRLLASSTGMTSALANPPRNGDYGSVSEELARISGVTGALATYLMNRDGLTVASSNWASEGPFVGRNFSFRPYFQEAMQGRLGRMFALGTTSGERGYFFAYPVRHEGEIVGAVVVKMDVSILERGWQSQAHEILVVDDFGVVFLSSRPEWRLKSLGVLPADVRQHLEQSRRYADRRIAPLELVSDPQSDIISIGPGAADPEFGSLRPVQRKFFVLETGMADAGWRVMILADATVIDERVRFALLIAGFMLASVALLALNISQRRRRLNERLELQEAAKTQLEGRVLERTKDLSRAVSQLQSEVDERERAEADLRRTQEELIQASKLAALGRLSAGLSHELNQPLTAIRGYAENARVFLSREDQPMADANLGRIAEMSERMARIIRNLRTYARNESVGERPTVIQQPIRDALALLDSELRKADVEVVLDVGEADIWVIGGDVRLQQVFVNFISNAIYAMTGGSERRLEVRAAIVDDEVSVTVSDTGSGIAPDDLARVFDPFFTTKDVGQGTGLGLSISYGIIKSFGGRIGVSSGRERGTTFDVRLRPAKLQREAAE